MRDYRLYQYYVLEGGLAFLPKGKDDEAWEITTELMLRALVKEGPDVMHDVIALIMANQSRQANVIPEDAG